ncbi:MAG: aminopeptidase N [Endozoicomonadaceae bacterium]|nr:aminopeptidase N [Endozoicomonadaceae bacterium]
MDATSKMIYLKDYQQPAYWIKKTDLVFDLNQKHTQVTSTLHIVLNEFKPITTLPVLILDGKDLILKSVRINHEILSDTEYEEIADKLKIQPTEKQFYITIVTELAPHENTTLEGLYQSNGIYCTQCEAEGFRRITYYLDRPDVMAVFTTTLIANQTQYPILLSNGNLVDSATLPDGRHTATWEDPFPKPSYLFAIVAGNLMCHEDAFITKSKRTVLLKIFTEPAYIKECDYAMDALKRAMQWDEEKYGREYDLDIFMIVAIDAFNMGAMENKGLNIFNASCILGDSNTATDSVFQRIESIVGHEYFHNWSGNRVTCRDWFQLSLKEGFTVFRDQSFSADMNASTVQRIQDVNQLRTVQFLEDLGPMAHPVRPEKFIEISNFYTSTIYEKGAEVIRMLSHILGPDLFRKGCDLYFDRHDGEAVTCDDFVAALESVSQLDLIQFKRWYWQAGTPVVQGIGEYDKSEAVYRLHLKQYCPPTPGQIDKLPFVIPIKLGLLGADNQLLPVTESGETETVVLMKKSQHVLIFENISSKPIPSLMRDFSAPITMRFSYTRAELISLIQYDTNEFNRWESMQRLLVSIIHEIYEHIQSNQTIQIDAQLEVLFRALLTQDNHLNWAFLSELFALPTFTYLGSNLPALHIHHLYAARKAVKQHLATTLVDIWYEKYQLLNKITPYYPIAEDIGERSFKNTCLSYIMALQSEESVQLAKQQCVHSNNLTDTLAGLNGLIQSEHPTASVMRQSMLCELNTQWSNQSNLMNYWFSVQASDEKTALKHILELMKHDAFSLTNPNKVRSVIGSFCRTNVVQFHALDRSGYAFLLDTILKLDSINPRMSAALLSPLTQWKRYDALYQVGMKNVLEQILAEKNISVDVFEIISKSLS